MARTTIATPGFLDRLGDRVVVTDRTGGDLEVLRLRPELTADAGFEACLKSIAEQLSAFQHRGVARVRGISRLPAPDGRLAIVSDAARGWRLSEVLQAAEQETQLIHTSTVLFILRQVASAIAALQSAAPGIGHGALGPERVVLNPAGRVVVVEYVLGAALEHLPFSSPDKLWKELRIAVPAEAAEQRFTPHTDVLQLGIIALSLIHNRLLRRDEYPARLGELLDSATESRVTGARQPIGPSLRRWLEQTLGIARDAAQWTMEDAQRGLDRIVSKEGGYFSTPVGLEPLLQAVDRFFTVPPASDDAPAEASVDKEKEEEAPVAKGPEPAVSTREEAAVALPTEPPPAVEHPIVEDEASPHESAPPDVAATTPRVLTLVRPAEHHSDPFPVPPDVTPASPTRSSSHTSVSASMSSPADIIVPDLSVPDVAPVADMLAIDRPASARRSGWSGEAWLSRSSDRTPSGARPIVAASGATARIAKSGGMATAVALRREVTPPEPSAAVEERPLPEPVAPPLAEPAALAKGSRPAQSGAVKTAEQPHRPVAAPPSNQRGSALSAPTSPSSYGPTSRSLFGVDSNAHEEHAASDHDASGGGKAKWLAVAAVVILCAGGFAGWTLLKPSAGNVVKGKNDPPAAGLAQPAAAPASSPGASSTSTQAPAAPAPDVVRPGTAAAAGSVATPPAEAAPAAGAVLLVSPLVVGISEKGESLGTSAAPVAMAAGRHVLDVANDEVGYRATQVVDVRPGRTTRIPLALPRGAININATPWAEVLVDGQRLGETPLGNVQLTVGSHEVKFRHPQLGEQVRTVLVTTGSPGRLSVDMKQ